jgi:hypothetical protein
MSMMFSALPAFACYATLAHTNVLDAGCIFQMMTLVALVALYTVVCVTLLRGNPIGATALVLEAGIPRWVISSIAEVAHFLALAIALVVSHLSIVTRAIRLHAFTSRR